MHSIIAKTIFSRSQFALTASQTSAKLQPLAEGGDPVIKPAERNEEGEGDVVYAEHQDDDDSKQHLFLNDGKNWDDEVSFHFLLFFNPTFPYSWST